MDVYFIFSDGSTITARELDRAVKSTAPWRGRGSNTPFWLFQKSDTRPCLDFETVYPAELLACDWADLVWDGRLFSKAPALKSKTASKATKSVAASDLELPHAINRGVDF